MVGIQRNGDKKFVLVLQLEIHYFNQKHIFEDNLLNLPPDGALETDDLFPSRCRIF